MKDLTMEGDLLKKKKKNKSVTGARDKLLGGIYPQAKLVQ